MSQHTADSCASFKAFLAFSTAALKTFSSGFSGLPAGFDVVGVDVPLVEGCALASRLLIAAAEGVAKSAILISSAYNLTGAVIRAIGRRASGAVYLLL